MIWLPSTVIYLYSSTEKSSINQRKDISLLHVLLRSSYFFVKLLEEEQKQSYSSNEQWLHSCLHIPFFHYLGNTVLKWLTTYRFTLLTCSLPIKHHIFLYYCHPWYRRYVIWLLQTWKACMFLPFIYTLI